MASFNDPKLSNHIADDVSSIRALLRSLAQLDPATGNADIPSGAKRLVSGTSGYELQSYNGTSWVTLDKFNIDAQKVDGYSASTGTTASTIPVRDANGKLPGDITGNAATATKAAALSSTNPIGTGGTGATTVEQARNNLGVPPTNHASAGTDYGIGNASKYGHLKLSNSTNSALAMDGGTAATPIAVKTAKENAISIADKALNKFADAQAAKDAEQDAAIVAAQSSADAAQSSADAAIAGLEGVVRSVNGVGADAAGNVWLSTVPTGSVIAFAQGWIPDGFLHCNGAAISRSTYANLFAHVGTIYGAGDGSTTFNLPQLADGRFIRGAASDIGIYLEPGLPNIWGQFTYDTVFVQSAGQFYGAFAGTHLQNYDFATGKSSNPVYQTDFNAARSNGHYGRYEDVIPRSVHMVYGIKY